VQGDKWVVLPIVTTLSNFKITDYSFAA